MPNRRTIWRLLTAALLVVPCATAAIAAAPLPPGVEIVESAEGRLVLDVQPPEPRWLTDPLRGQRVVVPGYSLQDDGDWPWLPQARLLLDVPRPRGTRLQVEVLRSRPLAGRQSRTPLVVDRILDPAQPQGVGSSRWRRGVPQDLPLDLAAARLGEAGAMRRNTFQEILFSPVLPVSAEGALIFVEHYRVTVTWPAGGSAAARGRGVDQSFNTQSRRWLLPSHGQAARGGQATGGDESVGRPVSDPASATAMTTETSAATTGPVQQFEAEANAVLRPAVPLTPDAGSTVYRLSVTGDGLYRLDGAWLAAFAADLLGRPVNNIFLSANGVELPLRLEDDGDGVLSGGDVISFYGEMVDEDPLDPDDWQQGDYTDTRPYFLGAAAGARLRMSTALSGAPVSGFAALDNFQSTVHVETDNIFLNSVPEDESSRWYDQPFLSHLAPLRQVTMDLPDADPAAMASLRVRMLGALISGNLAGLHRTRLSVNDAQLDEADWDGVIVYTQGVDSPAITFSASLLTAASTVDVELPLTRMDGGVTLTTDLVALDWVEVTYGRQFVADGNALLFSVPNQDATITISGFTGADAAVYEITGTSGGVVAPAHLAGAAIGGSGLWDLTFELAAADSASAERRFVVSAGAGLQPAQAQALPPLQDLTAGGADWLVIAADGLLDTAPTSNFSDLVALRQSQGLQTAVVPLDQVYRQFSYGLMDPQAIRDFIAWSLTQWTPAPLYVVLAGDASFDTKNNYGNAANRNLLPTFMASKVSSPDLTYFSMDNRFAAVIGPDDLPDVLLGRLPVHDMAEAEGLFAKILAYESSVSGTPWTRRGFFISDKEEFNFESSLRLPIDDYMDRPENPGFMDPNGPCFATGTCRNDASGPGPLFATAGMQALVNREPGTPLSVLNGTMRQWIKDGLDDGAVFTHYHGHGGFQTWGRDVDIFTTSGTGPDDIDDLTNGAGLTFMFNVNCITGGFHADSPPGAFADLQYTLAEDLVVTADRGAIGALAPSHLTYISLLETAATSMWDTLLGDERERSLGGINLALRLTFNNIGATNDLRSYAFLGDPATHLLLPDPAPPGVPVAVAGNKVVDLSWSAGPDASTFIVERSLSGAAGPYTAISPPGLAATAYSDTAVDNARTYHYRVRGRDSDGMDSVPANTNADCPDGPGCVVAVPLNPDPPAMPVGFDATDTGAGGQLQLTWQANAEPDVKFYRVRYGVDPGALDQETTFNKPLTQGLLSGLVDDQALTMTLEAVNTSGLTGPPTAPVVAIPRFVLGLRLPRSIGDLQVLREGDDVVLEWGAVDEDQYGDPISLSAYTVFGSAVSPSFAPGPATELAEVSDEVSPSWRHVGGIAGNGIRFYLVQSADSSGARSAAGSGLPMPVQDLQVEVMAGGMLRLSWSPVSLSVAGARLAVDHYEVYAGATPFRREDLPGMTAIRPLVLETAVEVAEIEGDFFSVVAVTVQGDMSPY